MNNRSGFTFVELSIVLIIIGLLPIYGYCADSNSVNKVPVPTQGAYLGASVLYGDINFPQFEQMLGKPLAIQQLFFEDGHNFNDHIKMAPSGVFEMVNGNHNTIPMITVQSKQRTLAEINSNTINLADDRFNHEQLPDEYYRKLARAFKAYGKPMFLRWNQEMNAPWYPFCTTPGKPKCFDRDTNRQQEPQDFVNAWRHVHDIFAQEGVTNVSWVWCPAAKEFGDMRDVYPGDAYVDWIGLDGYNKSPPNPWMSFDQVFAKAYNDIVQIAPSKPVMIAEFGSHTGDDATGERKAQWMTDAFARIPAYTHIKAVFIFNVDSSKNTNVNEPFDWQVQNNPIILNAARNAVGNSYYLSYMQ